MSYRSGRAGWIATNYLAVRISFSVGINEMGDEYSGTNGSVKQVSGSIHVDVENKPQRPGGWSERRKERPESSGKGEPVESYPGGDGRHTRFM